VDEWFFKYLAGIRPDPAGPGFQHFFIHPVPMGNLTWVKAHYDSVHGRIVSEWKKEGGKFTLHVVVPPNTSAAIYLPTDNPDSILESGRPVTKSVGVAFSRIKDGDSVFDVLSGSYSFEVEK
jgi:alpha-L-rhamnosidase